MKPCSKCGAIIHAVYLRDGVCNACRNPESVVMAVVSLKDEDNEGDLIEVHKGCNEQTKWIGEDGIAYCPMCEAVVESDTEWITEAEQERRLNGGEQ